MNDYPAFGKIPRLHREVVLTEKIDGTNGLISIEQLEDGAIIVRAGSRNRWLTPEKGNDNHGFARWVEDNALTLHHDLGLGRHYGEWWGKGIGKRYGQVVDDKYFSLFNVSRWESHAFLTPNLRVVPVLARPNGANLSPILGYVVDALRSTGSLAAPGAVAEGVVVFHTASNHLYKVTLEKDEEYKGANRT